MLEDLPKNVLAYTASVFREELITSCQSIQCHNPEDHNMKIMYVLILCAVYLMII
jgi:hypothetical protein